MRASFYGGAGVFSTGAAETPVPAGDETLLRVRRVGICGTDLHIFQGHLDNRIPRGGIIGHETLAEVVEAPAGGGFRAGDRVVVEPLSVCGTCRACRMGADYICYGLKVYGVDLPGSMREYWAAPTTRLIKVPDALGDEQAALMEPLAIAVHDVRRAAVKAGDTVLVLGGGPIGALIALVCRNLGARVAVSEVNPFRLDLLGRYGLQTVRGDGDVAAFAEDWTGGTGVDIAFEVTGNPAAARVVADVVRVWGTISMVAIHAEPIPFNLYRMFARELNLHGSRLYTRADWDEAIRLAASKAFDVAPLVSRVIPLDGLADGMREALAGGPVMKILVDVTR